MTEWQPIATAPKDRQILVYDEGAIFISVWVENAPVWGRDKSGWWDNGIVEPPPTHWMELPDPPAKGTA